MTHPNKREVHSKAMELNKKRKECNEAILRKLKEYLNANPGIRFSQALSNLDIVSQWIDYENVGNYWVDEYYTEPEVILKRMR